MNDRSSIVVLIGDNRNVVESREAVEITSKATAQGTWGCHRERAGWCLLNLPFSLIAECDLNAFYLRRASRWWGRAYYVLGMPAVVLATIAGATGLASTAGRVPAAIIALIAAGLTAAATFLNSCDNQRNNIVMSAAWSELADDARLHNLSYIQAMRGVERSQRRARNNQWVL